MLSEPVKTDVYLKEKSSRLARHPIKTAGHCYNIVNCSLTTAESVLSELLVWDQTRKGVRGNSSKKKYQQRARIK